MNEQAVNWMDIGKLDDIPVQGSRRIDLNGVTVAVFRTSRKGRSSVIRLDRMVSEY